MKEKNSIYSARPSNNQNTKTFWYDRQGHCAQAAWILTFFPPKRKVYYTFEDGPVHLVYPVHSSLRIFFVLFPNVQLSSTSLPTSRLRSLSRFKSKSKSNRHLSSNAFSHSFSPHQHQRQLQSHHHECLPQDSESLCVHPHRQTPSSRPALHLKVVNNLKLKRLESNPRSLDIKFRPPYPTNILSKYFAVYPPFLLMWASPVTPTLCIIRCFVSHLLEPTSLAASTPHFVHLVKPSSVLRPPNKTHMYSYRTIHRFLPMPTETLMLITSTQWYLLLML